MGKKENHKSFSITHNDIAVLNAIIHVFTNYNKLPTAQDIRSLSNLASPTVLYSIKKLVKMNIVVPINIKINKKKGYVTHYKPILDVVYVAEPNVYLVVTQNGAILFSVSLPDLPEYQRFKEPGNIFSISELPNELRQFFTIYPLTIDYHYLAKKNEYMSLLDSLLSKYFRSTRRRVQRIINS